MAKTVKRKTTTKAIDVAKTLRQFLTLRVQSETLDERMGALKSALMDAVESSGYQDNKGSFWLELDEDVTVDGFGTVGKLKRERRTSQNLDPAKAEALLKRKGLWKDVIEHIPVIDEEKVMVAHFEGKISEEEIEEMYPSKITYAFKPVKG